MGGGRFWVRRADSRKMTGAIGIFAHTHILIAQLVKAELVWPGVLEVYSVSARVARMSCRTHWVPPRAVTCARTSGATRRRRTGLP